MTVVSPADCDQISCFDLERYIGLRLGLVLCIEHYVFGHENHFFLLVSVFISLPTSKHRIHSTKHFPFLILLTFINLDLLLTLISLTFIYATLSLKSTLLNPWKKPLLILAMNINCFPFLETLCPLAH